MKAAAAAALGLAVTAGGALGARPAHARVGEHWLSPDVLVAEAGTDVYVADLVGAQFVRWEELPHAPTSQARFALFSGEGPAVDLRPRARPLSVPVAATFLEPGAHLFVLDRAPVDVSLPAGAFDAHLREVGLAPLVADRAARGESSLPGTARVQWFEKALVRVGPPTDPVAGARFVGQTLELVPEHDPTDPTVATIPVRVALHGVAVPDQVIVAHRRAAGRTTVRLTTDESGRVALPLADGAYLLVTAHGERCAGCGDVQWTASFASYTFGRGPGTVRTPRLSAPVTVAAAAAAQKRALVVALLAVLGLAIAALCAIGERRTLGGPS